MNKYRAWDSEKKEMYEVFGWNEIDKEVYMCSVPESKFRDGSMHTWHQVTKQLDEVILMQSTGLKDKNGVEIFEGDYIQCKQYVGGNFVEYLYEVGYVEFKVAAFGLHRKQGFYRPFKDWLEDYEYEIQGNIYQNPELLKEVE
ncbi:YopX family protein [Enterococcus sp. LJL99]